MGKKTRVDFIPMKNVNSKDSINKLKSYKADIFVSMSFDQIIKKEVMHLPEKVLLVVTRSLAIL